MHRSVLQEICNIGAGNAATSLSEMISSPTDITTPQVKVMPPSLAGKVADMLGKNSATCAIRMRQDVLGLMLFVFPFPFIERLAGTFFPGTKIACQEDIDEMTASVVNETVNISAAAYANSLSLMTGLTVDISTPELVKHPSETILSSGAGGTDTLCAVNTGIKIVDCRDLYSVLVYPEFDSVRTIMERIGMDL